MSDFKAMAAVAMRHRETAELERLRRLELAVAKVLIGHETLSHLDGMVNNPGLMVELSKAKR